MRTVAVVPDTWKIVGAARRAESMRTVTVVPDTRNRTPRGSVRVGHHIVGREISRCLTLVCFSDPSSAASVDLRPR